MAASTKTSPRRPWRYSRCCPSRVPSPPPGPRCPRASGMRGLPCETSRRCSFPWLTASSCWSPPLWRALWCGWRLRERWCRESWCKDRRAIGTAPSRAWNLAAHAMPPRPRRQAPGWPRRSGAPPRTARGRRSCRPAGPRPPELPHPRLREVARGRPGLVRPARHGADEPLERFLRREHLHRPRPAPYLPVRPLLHVAGPQALPVRGGEVEAGEGVGPRLLEDLRRLGAALRQHVAGDAVHGDGRAGVLGAERRGEDPADARPSCREPASRMRSRIRCAAQRCQAAPWKTSPTALTRPGWASDTTRRTPGTPRDLTPRGNSSHES